MYPPPLVQWYLSLVHLVQISISINANSKLGTKLKPSSQHRNLFFYDKSIFVNYVPGSHITTDRAAVCVRSCPSRALSNVAELQAFYNQTGSSLCWYDVPPGSFFDGAAHGRDRCPSLAIEPQ